MKPALLTALLLTVSNLFMTIAWYGHLKFEKAALWKVIAVSWLIALLEYCFQVPANRWGHEGGVSAAQLKVMQEVITLVVRTARPKSSSRRCAVTRAVSFPRK